MNDILPLLIFVLSYTGIAIGWIPGLAINRTGIAMLGTIAMIATASLSITEAVCSVDIATILLLYSLMIISAQFRLGGFYTYIANKVTNILYKPKFFLFVLMLVAAIISSLLTNDIVCFAFTPVIVLSLLTSELNPIPFLLGLAISSNIGSAVTIIGNPQNIFIGQIGQVDFGKFVLWCLPPSLISLIAAYFFILYIYRDNMVLNKRVYNYTEFKSDLPKFKLWPTLKGGICTFVLIGLFFTNISRDISAISIAGILLCSRTTRTENLLGRIDWNLITLFCSLFIIIGGFSKTIYPELFFEYLNNAGINFNLWQLPLITVFASNIFSNVPAVILIAEFIKNSNPQTWYVMALASTYAGNLIIIGSIANLIIIEQSKLYGINISFREHAKTGIPVTMVSLLILYLWMFIVVG